MFSTQSNRLILAASKRKNTNWWRVRKQTEGTNQQHEQHVTGSQHETGRGRGAAKNMYVNTCGMEGKKDRKEKMWTDRMIGKLKKTYILLDFWILNPQRTLGIQMSSLGAESKNGIKTENFKRCLISWCYFLKELNGSLWWDQALNCSANTQTSVRFSVWSTNQANVCVYLLIMIWLLVKIYTLHIHSRTEGSKRSLNTQSVKIVYFIINV